MWQFLFRTRQPQCYYNLDMRCRNWQAQRISTMCWWTVQLFPFKIVAGQKYKRQEKFKTRDSDGLFFQATTCPILCKNYKKQYWIILCFVVQPRPVGCLLLPHHRVQRETNQNIKEVLCLIDHHVTMRQVFFRLCTYRYSCVIDLDDTLRHFIHALFSESICRVLSECCRGDPREFPFSGNVGEFNGLTWQLRGLSKSRFSWNSEFPGNLEITKFPRKVGSFILFSKVSG